MERLARELLLVDKIMPMTGMHSGIHLVGKKETEALTFILDRNGIVEGLDTKIEKGDKVDVKGSRITIAGKPAIIAAEVKKGDSTLSLGTVQAFLHGQDGGGSLAVYLYSVTL